MGRDEVGVIHRSVAVLRLLADAPEGLALSDVATRLGYAKASAHRLLANLESAGLVYQAGRGQVYRLGATLLRLAGSYLEHLDIQRTARPYLDRLRQESGETASLHLLMDAGVVCVAVRESPHDLRLSGRIGTIAPLGRGANGKLLQALTVEPAPPGLEPIRRLGFAATCNERVPGAWSVAAPLFDGTGQARASISLRGPTARFSTESAVENALRLLAAAHEISADMGTVRSAAPPDRPEIEAVMGRLEAACRGAEIPST